MAYGIQHYTDTYTLSYLYTQHICTHSTQTRTTHIQTNIHTKCTHTHACQMHAHKTHTHNKDMRPLVRAECPRAHPHTPATTMGASTQPSGNPAEEQDLSNKTYQLLTHSCGLLYITST